MELLTAALRATLKSFGPLMSRCIHPWKTSPSGRSAGLVCWFSHSKSWRTRAPEEPSTPQRVPRSTLRTGGALSGSETRS
eukprot:8443413-Pyramimonas_sp.AAC.1